jgi:transcriptional regulator with XRE-family HTH domain
MCTVSEQPQTAGAESTHDIPLEALGRVLRRAREASGIGVREMAGRLGCSPSHISQVERGVTSPSVHTLFSMVGELGLSLDDLLAAATSDTPSLNTADIGPWPGRIVRSADRRGISLPGGVKWEMLIPAIEDGFEFVEYVYEVGGHDGDDFFRRNCVRLQRPPPVLERRRCPRPGGLGLAQPGGRGRLGQRSPSLRDAHRDCGRRHVGVLHRHGETRGG